MSIYNVFSTFIKHIAAANSTNIYFITHMCNLFHWNLAIAAHLDFSDLNLGQLFSYKYKVMLLEHFTQQTSTHLPAYSHLGAEGMTSNPHELVASSPEEPTNRITHPTVLLGVHE
jgi:hypothetical protein